MVKTLMLGFATLVFSFFVGLSYVNAQQEETPTPTPTPVETEDVADDDVPTAPPQTGFGI